MQPSMHVSLERAWLLLTAVLLLAAGRAATIRAVHRRPAAGALYRTRVPNLLAVPTATVDGATDDNSGTIPVAPFTWHAPSRQQQQQQQQQLQQQAPQQQQQQAKQARPLTPADVIKRQSSSVSCSADAASKQTCLFNNVCLIPTPNSNDSLPPQLTVVLQNPSGNTSSSSGSSTAAHRAVALLQQLLDRILSGQGDYRGTTYITNQAATHCSDASDTTAANSSSSRAQAAICAALQDDIYTTSASIHVDPGVTVLWRPSPGNQDSFGHALLNEAFPMFMVLSNHFGVGPGDLPRQLQLLISADSWGASVLPHVLADTISHKMWLMKDKLTWMQQQGKAGVCFSHLLLGDGGYLSASRASLANSGKHEAEMYATGPSFFSSRNWLAYRTYSLQVAGVVEQMQPSRRPLVLLNDKRYYAGDHSSLKLDRRMILDIEQLAANISAVHPAADIVPVRFRDLPWPDQLRLMCQASVFITTQGSSAFRWVWLPRGATVVVIGAPEGPGHTEWKSFHELDRWFSLTYVNFGRYHVNASNAEDYVLSVKPKQWQPKDPDARKRWLMYNADVRVRLDRLRPMLDQALAV